MEEFVRSALPWVAGILLCAAVTVVQLHEQYKSWPFGDIRHKAAVLWMAMCMFDAAVGVLLSGLGAAISMAGSMQISLVGQTYWGPAILVPMIPLALRSPVRKVEIAGQEVSVGITEYYDRVRLSILRRIDDRQTALVRSRNYATARELMASGLSFLDFEKEAREHFFGPQGLDLRASERDDREAECGVHSAYRSRALSGPGRPPARAAVGKHH